MAINWFEGGRRITYLFAGGAVLCGLAYTVMASEPTLTFSTDTPDDGWHFNTDYCGYPSEDRYVDSHDFGDGEQRSVKLCFNASINDKIPFANAPAPKDEQQRVYGDEDGKLYLKPERDYYYLGTSMDDSVSAYVNRRVDEFTLTPAMEAEVKSKLRSIYWSSRWQALNDATQIVGGFVVALFIFSFVVGWIVRGFAGIPSGKDFKEGVN